MNPLDLEKFDNMADNVKNSIFDNEMYFKDNYVPDTVIARDEQIDIMINNFSAILRGGEPSNMYLWGDPGVGKSLSSYSVLKFYKEGIKIRGLDIIFDFVTINCTILNNDISVLIEILSNLTGTKWTRGFSVEDYYKDLWDTIDRKAQKCKIYSLIVFFDEIDSYNDPSVMLYQLSRALAHHNVISSNVTINIIIASNVWDYLNKLMSKINSSCKFKECPFPNYNKDELYEILQDRKKGFVEGAITDEMIEDIAIKTADLYCGDARRAIDVLYEAGTKAVKSGSKKVIAEHVRDAELIVDDKRMKNMLLKIPLHDRILLISIYFSNLILNKYPQYMPVHTPLLTSFYLKFCDLLSSPTISDPTIAQHLVQLEDSRKIHREEIKGYGHIKFYQLPSDFNRIIDSVCPPLLKEKFYNNYSDFESLALKNGKKIIKN